MIYKIALITFFFLFVSNGSYAQSIHFFKTTETLELEKKTALEASDSDTFKSITEELDTRAKENEKISRLETELNQKIEMEAYLEAETIKLQIEKLKSDQIKISELRKNIVSSLAIEDYETADQYKTALSKLGKQTPTIQQLQSDSNTKKELDIADSKKSQTASDTKVNDVVISTEKNHAFTLGQEYGGGYIFYIDASGEHGLIASKADYHEPVAWGKGRKKTGITSTKSGATNSQKLNAEFGDQMAAGVCENMVSGGFDDWYLPAIDELLLLYKNKDHVKDIGLVLRSRENESGIKTYQWKNDYISSTEQAQGIDCLGVHFSREGKEFYYNREEKYRVRAIRKF
jgi:hypothetical protein